MLSQRPVSALRFVTGEPFRIAYNTCFLPSLHLTITYFLLNYTQGLATMAAETLAVPDPDVLAAANDSTNGGIGGAAMRRASSTSSNYSHISDASSSGIADETRPTLSRASSIAYSDDGSMTPSFRTHHSSASASMEGIDLLGAPSSSAGALPLSGKHFPPSPFSLLVTERF